uniref:Uncharacterized protein PM1478 n=2 Tax=Anthurium amnicola TaxID=1678845 RepID=A0A1D1XWB3_9ARAE
MACGTLLCGFVGSNGMQTLGIRKASPCYGAGVCHLGSGSVGRFLHHCYPCRSPSRPLALKPMGGCGGRRATGMTLHFCNARKKGEAPGQKLAAEEGGTQMATRAQQAALWTAEAAYILWLFLLPYAPGDPVWAISPGTVSDLVGLSLNFFFILPILNSVGIHAMEAPVLHPMSEGLFNFVLGWTFMFAPLLFTDCRRDRYKGSLDILWGLQMFLTNTFLIPYMAIRLNNIDDCYSPKKPSQFVSLMTGGAPVVGIIGGAVCLFSILWAVHGRADGGFGGLTDRLEFLGRYLGSERLAYAFVWDIILYAIFQPWLIGDNLQNVEESTLGVVRSLRFIPVVGLIAYLLCLKDGKKFHSV